MSEQKVAPLELAMQEFEVDQLEDLDAPGFSDAASAVSGAVAGISISAGVASWILT